MCEDSKKHPLNVQGRYYITDDCLACRACEETAPNNIRFASEYGMSYVFKQPSTPEEKKQCREALDECYVAAIRDNGNT